MRTLTIAAMVLTAACGVAREEEELATQGSAALHSKRVDVLGFRFRDGAEQRPQRFTLNVWSSNRVQVLKCEISAAQQAARCDNGKTARVRGLTKPFLVAGLDMSELVSEEPDRVEPSPDNPSVEVHWEPGTGLLHDLFGIGLQGQCVADQSDRDSCTHSCATVPGAVSSQVTTTGDIHNCYAWCECLGAGDKVIGNRKLISSAPHLDELQPL